MQRMIETREDVAQLVEAFYAKALSDPEIGFIFTEIAEISPSTHFPKIIDFWESVLLDAPRYGGNVMQKHLALHAKSPLEPAHFLRWLSLWEATVRELFSGELAERAIQRAQSIATMMQVKIRRGGQF